MEAWTDKDRHISVRGLPPRGFANRGVSALRGEAAPADRGEAKRAEGDEPRALRVLPANGGGGAGGKARSGGTFFGDLATVIVARAACTKTHSWLFR